uniref:Uncharacterized protein n=1 Tax=Knipowitschia caucasica TaxID=637954 RepID=A0AAV2JM68_KNICA
MKEEPEEQTPRHQRLLSFCCTASNVLIMAASFSLTSLFRQPSMPTHTPLPLSPPSPPASANKSPDEGGPDWSEERRPNAERSHKKTSAERAESSN